LAFWEFIVFILFVLASGQNFDFWFLILICVFLEVDLLKNPPRRPAGNDCPAALRVLTGRIKPWS
jgi:hypothetical protein